MTTEEKLDAVLDAQIKQGQQLDLVLLAVRSVVADGAASKSRESLLARLDSWLDVREQDSQGLIKLRAL